MQRKCLRSLYILCKRYQLPPYSSKPSSLYPPFQELHSKYLHFGSSETRPRRVYDLINLKNNQDGSETSYDEFGDDVEKVYSILKRFHTRVPKLELALKQSGVVVREGLTQRVLDRCGEATNFGYLFFVSASKHRGYRHSHDVYIAMIDGLGKMRQFGAAWALIEELKRNGKSEPLPAEVFIVLMVRYAKARLMKQVTEVLNEMPKYGCEPDEDVFERLLHDLCRKGSVKEAAVLFEDRRFNFRRTIRHFTLLMYGWGMEGKIMKVKNVLIKMRNEGLEPDVGVYNALLNGYAVAGQMGDAFDLLMEMKKQGCGPNVASFKIVIRSLCAQKRMEEAMRVFLDMDRSGCEADDRFYTTLISGFAKWGEIEKAYLILDQMIQKGHPPSSTTYMYIMFAHEKKDQLEECLELKEEMRKIGMIPDVSIYNTIIRLAFKLGDVEEGIRLWNEIETNRKSPQLDTFTIMINGFVDQGRLVEACDYYKEMIMRGLMSRPQYRTLKSLLNSLLKDDKLEMSKDVWKCMMTKGCEVDQYTWNIWIHALCSNKHVIEACSYCINMMDANLMPQPELYARLMRGLKDLYNIEIATKITVKVRKMAEKRQMTFKMYKRWGEISLDQKEKEKEIYLRRRKTPQYRPFHGLNIEIATESL